MDLLVRVASRDGWTIAAVDGDIDLTTAPRLREVVIGAISGNGGCRVVLDLEHVDFLDSSGLGVVVGLLKRTRAQGGDLRLVSTRSHLLNLLRVTALDSALPLFGSIDAAIGAAPPAGE